MSIQVRFYHIARYKHDTSTSLHIMRIEGVAMADSGITLQEVATRAGIDKLDIFDQECSQKMLLNLAKHCVEWTLIGLYLDLKRADIAAVNGDYQTVDEKRVGMLGRWKDKFAFKATYKVFIEALLACGKTEDAVDACKTIAKGKAGNFGKH